MAIANIHLGILNYCLRFPPVRDGLILIVIFAVLRIAWAILKAALLEVAYYSSNMVFRVDLIRAEDILTAFIFAVCSVIAAIAMYLVIKAAATLGMGDHSAVTYLESLMSTAKAREIFDAMEQAPRVQLTMAQVTAKLMVTHDVHLNSQYVYNSLALQSAKYMKRAQLTPSSNNQVVPTSEGSAAKAIPKNAISLMVIDKDDEDTFAKSLENESLEDIIDATMLKNFEIENYRLGFLKVHKEKVQALVYLADKTMSRCVCLFLQFACYIDTRVAYSLTFVSSCRTLPFTLSFHNNTGCLALCTAST